MLTDAERSYDRYVTVERPGSWNHGYNDAYYGEPFDDNGEASDEAYKEGWHAGLADHFADSAAGEAN